MKVEFSDQYCSALNNYGNVLKAGTAIVATRTSIVATRSSIIATHTVATYTSLAEYCPVPEGPA